MRNSKNTGKKITEISLPVISTKSYTEKLKKYQTRFIDLLNIEFSEELLIEQGAVVTDLTANFVRKIPTGNVIKLTHQKKNSFASFSKLESILLKATNSNTVIEGTVLERNIHGLTIIIDILPTLANIRWKLEKAQSGLDSKNIMMVNLELFCSNMKMQSKQFSNYHQISEKYYPATGNPIKRIIIGDGSVSLAQEASIMTPLNLTLDFNKETKDWKINVSQREVMNDVLRRKFSLIQGPPGTGKSHVAILLLRFLAPIYSKQNLQLLATSFTNIAVDNLVEGLLSYGVNVIRLGRAVKAREDLYKSTLAYHMTQHPEYKSLSMMMQEHSTHKQRDIFELENKIKREVVKKAHVVCCTNIVSGSYLCDLYFPTVLIDEATQAVETATLVSLTKAAQHVVLLGDHFQLPPTVLNSKAVAAGFQVPLFERIVNEWKIKPLILKSQYRMHPMISEFPNSYWYKEVSDAITEKDRPLPTGFEWPNVKVPVCFVDLTDSSQIKDGTSSQNQIEASYLMRVTYNLLLAGVSPSYIGVLTPYLSQLNLIMASVDKYLIPTKNEYGENSRRIDVATIDGFQGREKEIIIFSTVRTQSVGFLSDWRRLNVALTRAKCGLIVIGSRKCLEKDKNWDAWFKWVDKQKVTIIENSEKEDIQKGLDSLKSEVTKLLEKYDQKEETHENEAKLQKPKEKPSNFEQNNNYQLQSQQKQITLSKGNANSTKNNSKTSPSNNFNDSNGFKMKRSDHELDECETSPAKKKLKSISNSDNYW
jgi:regulator of nonsense transcripts 1